MYLAYFFVKCEGARGMMYEERKVVVFCILRVVVTVVWAFLEH
jgi:hypothetical protein